MMSEVREQLQMLAYEDIPTAFVLNSVFEIENVLLLLHKIDKKIDYYKELKKSRIKSIDEELSELTYRKDRLKEVVLSTMRQQEPKEKTLKFPDIGQVTRRTIKSSYSITDEERFTEYADQAGILDQVTKATVSLDRREATKLVKNTENPEQIPGVSLSPAKDSLTIKYEVRQSEPAAPVKEKEPTDVWAELEELEL